MMVTALVLIIAGDKWTANIAKLTTVTPATKGTAP